MRRTTIYHLISSAEWAKAQSLGSYWPEAAQAEGFIHFSFAEQVRLTQQRYYRNRSDLLLLEVEVGALTSELRIENGFPHLYGPLPVGQVLKVQPRPCYRDLTVALAAPRADQSGGGWRDSLLQARQAQADLVVFSELSFEPWWPSQHRSSSWVPPSSRLPEVAQACQSYSLACVFTQTEEQPGGIANIGYLVDAQGQVLLRYQKMHLPNEAGFWEQEYFVPGQEPPALDEQLGMPMGLQICSDTFRPLGSYALACRGCSLIVIPRATETGTYQGWQAQLQSVARTTSSYVVSVNRAKDDNGMGGYHMVVDPQGRLLEQNSDSLSIVELEHRAVVEAKAAYPGYLAWQSSHYEDFWEAAVLNPFCPS